MVSSGVEERRSDARKEKKEEEKKRRRNGAEKEWIYSVGLSPAYLAGGTPWVPAPYKL